MSLIMPNGSRTVPLKPGGQFGGNNVMLHSQPNPYTFTPQQTNASYNWNRAQAAQKADPRFNAKQYQRGGISSSKGTASLGAADAANAYATGMANAEAARMQDAYSNANLQLSDQVERDRYSNALIGLQEQRNQANWMNDMQSMQNAYGFMGDMMGGMGKSGGGIFGGLMGGFNPASFMTQGQNILSGLL